MVENRKKLNTKKISAITNLHDLRVKDVVNHVKSLYKYINGQNSKIRKLKLKIRKMRYLSKLDKHIAAVKTEEELDEVEDYPETQSSENVLDFINDIKEAATNVAYEQAGFIFEPTSGLWYDQKSGYYYNSQYDLYYDGDSGTYYRLNQKNEFIFHSQVHGAPVDTKEKDEIIDENEAIRKILEDGRKPQKKIESISTQDKESKKKRPSRSSSEEDSYHRRKYHSRSRSRSRSRGRRNRSRSRERNRNRKYDDKKRRTRGHSDGEARKEDGECESSDSNKSIEQAQIETPTVQPKHRSKKKKQMAKKYPPSLRIVVVETNLDKIDVGKLFLVTYKGGSLGREGTHDVLIPDINISKTHLKFRYNHKRSMYQCIDMGSKNGTILNGIQISTMKQEESEPNNLEHESIIILSQTKLLCHIHDGYTTCTECEPYNYIKAPIVELKGSEALPSSLSHKEGLKAIQKRYGLETEKYQEKAAGTENKNYSDRSEKRRVKVGSSNDHEKTIQASVNTSISSSNKGFKLLSKMGWKEGSGIGKGNAGIKEPVHVKSQQGTSGFGSEAPALPIVMSFKKNSKKNYTWNKAQERYNNIQKPAEENIFGDHEDDE
ncbi:unnamed protein product [Diamesa serratosioi]